MYGVLAALLLSSWLVILFFLGNQRWINSKKSSNLREFLQNSQLIPCKAKMHNLSSTSLQSIVSLAKTTSKTHLKISQHWLVACFNSTQKNVSQYRIRFNYRCLINSKISRMGRIYALNSLSLNWMITIDLIWQNIDKWFIGTFKGDTLQLN